jgi:hypothetical protein
VAVFELLKVQSKAWRQKIRDVLFTARRDPAGVDRTEEVTRLVSALLRQAPTEEHRERFVACLIPAMAFQPNFSGALAVLASSRHQAVIADALEYLTTDSRTTEVMVSALRPIDRGHARAMERLENRRHDTDDAMTRLKNDARFMNLMGQHGESGRTGEPVLNNEEIRAAVKRELGGREPIASDEGGIFYNVLTQLEGRARPPEQILKECVEEAIAMLNAAPESGVEGIDSSPGEIAGPLDLLLDGLISQVRERLALGHDTALEPSH